MLAPCVREVSVDHGAAIGKPPDDDSKRSARRSRVLRFDHELERAERADATDDRKLRAEGAFAE
jgi:hypothetical protein